MFSSMITGASWNHRHLLPLSTGRRWASKRRQKWRRQSSFLSRAQNSPHMNCIAISLWTRGICQCEGVTFSPVTRRPL